jgi:hypothetical protein
MTSTRQKITPPEIARRWGIDSAKVLGWIKAGSLRAINVSDGEKRPRYLVDVDDLRTFEASRTAGPAPKPVRRRRVAVGTVDFFPEGGQ